jgi:hypothetical protein
MADSGTANRTFAIPSKAVGPRPWLLDTIHVIKSGNVYRAQPARKPVEYLQEVCWDGRGGILELPPQPGLRDIVYNADHTMVTAIVSADPGTDLEYLLKCDEHVVEGNSPPVIIVER